MSLMVGWSIIDILLMGKLILTHMEENNITDLRLVDENLIQEKYDQIMREHAWKYPETFPNIECPKCNRTSYNINDIKYKFCGNCNEWHADMKLEK